MKKLASVLLVVLLVISLFAGCGGKDNNPKSGDNNNTNTPSGDGKTITYKDGTYTAEQKDFAENSGWKANVTIEVQDGKIVKADWNGTHKEGGKDKKTSSKEGEYGMVEKGNASSEWHEQAEKAEAYLIETQDPSKIDLESDGSTDAIAGVTIKVKEFFELAQEALEKAK